MLPRSEFDLLCATSGVCCWREVAQTARSVSCGSSARSVVVPQKQAKAGQMKSVRIMAKDLVRIRKHQEKFINLTAQLRAISLQMTVSRKEERGQSNANSRSLQRRRSLRSPFCPLVSSVDGIDCSADRVDEESDQGETQGTSLLCSHPATASPCAAVPAADSSASFNLSLCSSPLSSRWFS